MSTHQTISDAAKRIHDWANDIRKLSTEPHIHISTAGRIQGRCFDILHEIKAITSTAERLNQQNQNEQ